MKKERKEKKKKLDLPLLIEVTCVDMYFPGFLSSAP